MPEVATRWTRICEAFSHAFAVRNEPLNDEQLSLLDRLADEIRKRRLTPVAAGGVELLRPVAGVTGHSVSFFEPLLSAFLPAGQIAAARDLLQHPGAIDALQERLEEGHGATTNATIHPPLGRVERSEGGDAADGDVDRTSDCPPRNSADAAFRPSPREGDIGNANNHAEGDA